MYCDQVQYLVERARENYSSFEVHYFCLLNLSDRLFSKLGMEKLQQLTVEDAIRQ